MADNTYYACFLKKFNNYFNRIIKGYDTLAEYQSAAEDYFLYSKAINYNPADNVSTELIMNDCDFDPDYVLILDKELDIVARWFVLETIFTREKQRKFILRRDVIYDNKDNLLNSPVFVQKAMLSDNDPFILNSEGMSFNEIKTSETLLKDRTNSAWIIGYIAKNAAATDVSIQVADDNFVSLTMADIASEVGISEADLSSIVNIDSDRTNPAYFTNEVEIRYGSSDSALIPHLTRTRLYFSPDFSTRTGERQEDVYSWANTLYKVNAYSDMWSLVIQADEIITNAIIANKANIVSSMSSITNRTYFTKTELNKLNSFIGKYVLYNGSYYQIDVETSSSTTEVFGPDAYTAYSAFATAINNAFADPDMEDLATLHNTGEISIRPKSSVVYFKLTYVSDTSSVVPSVSTKVSSSRKTIKNQAFDMFAIPYGSVQFKSDTGTSATIADNAITVAAKIATSLDAQCYDIQLLPYCPALENFDSDNIIDLTALTENEDFNYINKTNSTIRKVETAPGTVEEDPDNPGTYLAYANILIENFTASDITAHGYTLNGGDASYITNIVISVSQVGSDTRISLSGNVPSAQYDNFSVSFWYEYTGTVHQSFILWLNQATFYTQLEYSLSLQDSMKIESQCNKYRLCSPNYQGSFEFNVAKNGGSVAYFSAECTYKPYTPYIKVSPAFSWLYGSNYGDNRGLICGGDFSLPRFTSAWESYELNNKNYQNIFNREIQNLSFEQDLQMRQQLISGGLGVFTSGTVGAGVGAKVGGGWGALAGAVIGTGASALGMALDTDMLAKQQREQKSLAIDKFNYQLGNIKALPYTLTKVGAFDINSKIWPFLEYYTCTNEEKEALENKIAYESMTVMRIETFGNYFNRFDKPTYFKGELIRNEEIAEDNHIFEAIYSELLKGVYC